MGGGQEGGGLLRRADPCELWGGGAKELFPALAPVYGALYHRNAARVDGRLLNHALQQVAIQRGLTIQQGSVERLVLQQRAVTRGSLAGETLTAGQVIIAGGAGSQS